LPPFCVSGTAKHIGFFVCHKSHVKLSNLYVNEFTKPFAVFCPIDWNVPLSTNVSTSLPDSDNSNKRPEHMVIVMGGDGNV
jgi:hypothetical protein